MKVALLSLAVFGTELMTPVSDRVPELNMDALCKARSADNQKMQLPDLESVNYQLYQRCRGSTSVKLIPHHTGLFVCPIHVIRQTTHCVSNIGAKGLKSLGAPDSASCLRQ
jgi:hypothetical protein